jgi:hypothetical protein
MAIAPTVAHRRYVMIDRTSSSSWFVVVMTIDRSDSARAHVTTRPRSTTEGHGRGAPGPERNGATANDAAGAADGDDARVGRVLPLRVRADGGMVRDDT